MIARLKPGATIAEAQAQIDAHNAAVEEDNPEAKMMAEAGFRSLVGLACGSRPLDSSDTFADAGRRVFSPAHWRGQSDQPSSDPRERSSERNGDPPIDGREPRACREAGHDRNRSSDCDRRIARCLGGRVGNSHLLQVLGANRLPLGAHIAFDGWLASIGLVGAVVLGVVIAMPIAWFNLRSHLANALQSESRTGTISRAAQRLRHGFIVAQIALAFVLLAGAALLGLSLKKVMAVSPGFRPDHVLTGECTISWHLQRSESASSIACSNRSASNRESPPPERSRTFR